jgi:ribonuclease HII
VLIIGGVDEAGRGCAVGSLVVAAAAFGEKEIKELVRIGVKDSKKLSAHKRELLYPEIKKLADTVAIIRIPPSLMTAGSLNKLELIAMADVGNALRADVYYADACDSNPRRFEERLAAHVNKGTLVVAENRADDTYPSVSAASIIAKVERDRGLQEVRQVALDLGFPDLGTGYPSDARTVAFLKAYAKSGRHELDSHIRKNWSTWRRIERPRRNRS